MIEAYAAAIRAQALEDPTEALMAVHQQMCLHQDWAPRGGTPDPKWRLEKIGKLIGTFFKKTMCYFAMVFQGLLYLGDNTSEKWIKPAQHSSPQFSCSCRHE